MTVAVSGSCSSRRKAILEAPPRRSSRANPLARSEITTIPISRCSARRRLAMSMVSMVEMTGARMLMITASGSSSRGQVDQLAVVARPADYLDVGDVRHGARAVRLR